MIDKNKYLFAKTLENNYQIIKDEFLQIDNSLYTEWHEHNLYKGNWRVFPLTNFKGDIITKNCLKCPETIKLLSTVPGLRASGFSILYPQTVIYPHKGYSSEVYRLQLGLIVPNIFTLSGLITEGNIYNHKQGECIIFDDTLIHEAFNHSACIRVVLLVDFIK